MRIPKLIIKETISDATIGRQYVWSFLVLTDCNHTIILRAVKLWMPPARQLGGLILTMLQLEEQEEDVMTREYASKIQDLRKKLRNENWRDNQLLCNNCIIKKKQKSLKLV